MHNPYADTPWVSKSQTAFYDAFLACALWASVGEDGEPLDKTYHAWDLDIVTRGQLMLECRDFYSANYDDLVAHGTWEECGTDFFLTKSGHGSGFWDRGTGEVGDRLTVAAKAYGPTELYVGDDGRLYI